MKSISVLTLSVLIAATAQANRLLSPFDVVARRVATSMQGIVLTPSHSCASLIEPVIDFNVAGRYDSSDPTHSKVNLEAEAAYDAVAKPVQRFQQSVVKASDAFALSSDAKKIYADCTLMHLFSWARAGALLGEKSLPGYMQSSSTLIAAASAYQKIISAYPSKSATAEDQEKLKIIRQWFRKHEISISSYFSSVGGNTSLGNLRYGAGLAVGLSAIVTQNQDSFQWAMDSFRLGLAQIQPAGFLPIELSRGSRALSYHLLAAAPLSMLFKIASLNGVALNSKDIGQINHLINFIYKSLKDPSTMLAYDPTLPTQLMDFSCSEFAFLEVYLSQIAVLEGPRLTLERFNEQKRLECGDLYSTTLGGNMTYFFSR